jgi:hypothetical protein
VVWGAFIVLGDRLVYGIPYKRIKKEDREREEERGEGERERGEKRGGGREDPTYQWRK